MHARRDPALRLLFISSIPRWGGGERWMLDAALGLRERGHDVVLVCRRGSDLERRGREAGLRVRAIRMGGDFDPGALWSVGRVLGAHQPHAAFVNLDKELRYVAFASLMGKRPLLFPRRGSDDPLKASWLHRYTYAKRATRVLTNSARLARERLLVHEWLQKERVHVMRNGVPVPATGSETDAAALRRTLRLPRSRKLILHVGELEARKGQETTLRALARLVEVQAPPARDAPLLGFIGTGPDETRLRDVCHELGLQPYVTWIGFRKNVADYMRAADVVVLPTRREGLPWTLLEAMSHGVPVIASAVSGVPELVEDGETGLLVEPDDAEALARALRRILDDPELAARLRRNALQAVRRDWSREDMLHDLEALVYANLIRTQPPRGKRGAFFVDRDGTLIDNVPYNGKPDAVRLKPSVGRALRWVHEAGIPVVLVTNQSGVARGLHTLADVEAVNAQLTAQLEEQGAVLSGAYLCPHHPDFDATCDCRKPEPGLLLRAARELDVTLERSIMVGDNLRDLEAGRRAGAAAVAGYASEDSDSDLPQESRSRSWPRIVRDFLRAYWSEDWRYARDEAPPAAQPSARKDELA